ncbi:hypothetical protein LTR28_002372 [Elasticomyces elasticus]|nr:hypothetical protein LTR28_002372 [Elasticomyces elasticus]
MQKHANENNPWDLVAWECNRFAFNFVSVFPHYSNSERIKFTWDNLANRTTSHVRDEPLCIAILLDLDIDKLQTSTDADGVRNFWSLHVNCLPASVLFLPGKKLTNEGFRWAPANLMDLRIIGNDINSQARVTERGLYVSYPGFTLSQLEYPASCVIACIVDEEMFFIRRSLRNGTLPWKGLHLHTRMNLAVIILVIEGSAKKQFSGAVVEGSLEEDASGIETALGALVESQEGSHAHERYVSYLRFVIMVKKGSDADKYPNVLWSSKEIEEKERTPVPGTYLPNGQNWRVD